MKNAKTILALTLLGFLFIASCGSPESSAEEIVQRIPLGSEIGDLAGFLGTTREDMQVTQWVKPTPEDVPQAKDEHGDPINRTGRRVSNEFGTFTEKDLGKFEDWTPLQEGRDRFTGEIDFTVPNMASMDIVVLTYIDGKLRKKDWGHLPG